MKKRRTYPISQVKYTNWLVEAGRVTGSLHPVNRVYLKLRNIRDPKTGRKLDDGTEYALDLMEDEALAIIIVLSKAVFHANYERVRKAPPFKKDMK